MTVDPSTAFLRLRVIVAAAAMMVVALVAGGVFDRWIWTLLVAVGIPALFSLATVRRPLALQLAAGTVGAIVGTAAAVFIAGGRGTDLRAAAQSGLQRLLTTDWPSPDRPDLIGAVSLLLAVCSALATGLASRTRWHLVAIAPVLAAYIAVTALSAPLGARLGWLIPLGMLLVVFAILRPTGELSERWMLLRGERRLVPMILIASIIAGSISVPVALARRADPRRNDPASQTAALIDPIEATLALRGLDTSLDLHEITATQGQPLPTRWRTAALSNYDGQRWIPALTLRPIGRRLSSDADDALEYSVTFLDDDISLVPLPGAPITVDAQIETDSNRTVVRLSERPGDRTIAVTALLAPTTANAVEGAIATRPVDDSVTSLTEFADQIAGEGTVFERLRRIESTMRDEWVFDENTPGGGLQRTLIERFMRDTKRGTAEQFATSYVLLVRSLGVDARVATGYIAGTPARDGTLVLTSDDAAVWPEVRLLDGGWLALDPLPDEQTSDQAPPPEEPAVQTPAAAQPPIAPPPDPNDDTQTEEEIDDDATTRASAFEIWAQRVAIGVSGIGLPILLIAGMILGAKYLRRRRRLRSGAAADRVVGAWAVATDRLVDAGMTIQRSATNGDIARAGVPMALRADRELRRLATLSSAVTFGDPARPDLLVEDAQACLDHVESTMATDRSVLNRLRWRLSLRSLRRRTRSPVLD